MNPTPLSVDRAWNRADGRDMPVVVNAMVAIPETSNDSMATTTSRMTPVHRALSPMGHGADSAGPRALTNLVWNRR